MKVAEIYQDAINQLEMWSKPERIATAMIHDNAEQTTMGQARDWMVGVTILAALDQCGGKRLNAAKFLSDLSWVFDYYEETV